MDGETGGFGGTRGIPSPVQLGWLSFGGRLVADDQDWSWGDGEAINGPSEALAMALAGRPVALNDLQGPGVTLLRDRLNKSP